MPEQLEVWHEGCCGKCGRKLTDAESIARGIGPECYGKMSWNSTLPVAASYETQSAASKGFRAYRPLQMGPDSICGEMQLVAPEPASRTWR